MSLIRGAGVMSGRHQSTHVSRNAASLSGSVNETPIVSAYISKAARSSGLRSRVSMGGILLRVGVPMCAGAINGDV